jgi:hypothetical protein
MRIERALLACALSASLAGPAPAFSSDESQILQKLTTQQREYLWLASRDGSARLISYEPIRLLAYTRARAKPQAKPAPRAKPALKAKPAPKEKPPPQPDLVVSYGRTFVATTASVKPVNRPKPVVIRHDLAWEYLHRFDEPGPDGQIPGVPVRSEVSSPFDIRSGPFHGVRSTNGWSAVKVRVSIPCGAAHFATGYGYNEVTKQNGIIDVETGFIYIGGWGAGSRGVSVDAGLQKASAQAEADDYAFYFKYANNHPITYPIRFPCGGPDPILELYPLSDSLLVFSITGMTDQHRRMTMTIVQQTRPSDGWTPDGGSTSDGIILKRVVAIAQPPSWRSFFGLFHRDRFSNGSYFGVDGPSDHTPRITWQSCEIGRVVPPASTPTYHAWNNSETWHPSAPGVYMDWPPADVSRNTDGVCDAAGIFLRRS